jgi:glycosyltransferase involved in cell wall biosynthesis
MKIAYLNTYYRNTGTSGGNTHMKEFIEETVRSGHKIFAGAYNQHPKVQQIPTQLLRQIITLLACDVFYIRYEGNVTRTMQLRKYPQRIFSKHALIVWEFNTIPEYIMTNGGTTRELQAQKTLLQEEAKICDLAVCVTEEMADYFKNTIGFKKTLVVPNGSNPDHFRPGLSIPVRMEYFNDKINVVWAGSLHLSWNDTDLLVKTATNLWHIGRSDICFHMIGDFPSDLVQEIPPNVYLYGRQPYESLPTWLSAMDIGLILYKQRQNDFGSPIKLFDYLSSGLAIISTPHPQTSRILSEIGQIEFMLNAEDSLELSDLILRLADHPEKLQYFKQKAREIIVNKYNWATNVAKILNELNNLKEDKKSR